jgi:hypothetical protein
LGVLQVYKSIIAFPFFVLQTLKNCGDRLFARLVEQRRDCRGRGRLPGYLAGINFRGRGEGFVDSCRIKSRLRESCRLKQQSEALRDGEMRRRA